MSRTIMIMAGGTGGHIFPGIAVAEWLRAQGWHVVWLGSQAGMEAKLVPPRGYTMAWIAMSGVRGKGVKRALLLPWHLLVAFRQSLGALRRHRPDVVLGMGGYVSFPGGMMAALCRTPLAVHEQNSVPGLANRVLARVAGRVCTGFPDSLKSTKTQWTGNPVRAEMTAIDAPDARYRARSGPLRVTVLGGSLGAQALNASLPRALALLAEHERPLLTHQTGARDQAQVAADYAAAGIAATVLPFITDVARCYAESDLIVCRAGASTIAELAAAGVASVLVPFPYAVDDHQTHNARFLSERGAALLIPQHALTPEKLASLLRELTRERLREMAVQARAAAKPDATRDVAEACMRLAA